MKLSVAMITHNHERFIAQAIESVLAQKTDCDFELVIGEDCSTDKTREIVRGYQSRFGDKIRTLLPEKNLGMSINVAQTLSACRGHYVAVLEGDDYWISTDKLQKQLNFLDNHPECAICFHNARTCFEDDTVANANLCPQDLKEISTIEDLLERNFIPTCTTMFRSGLFRELPAWFYTLGIGDWPLHILNAEHGKIGYINEVMAAYRIHPDGLWSKRSNIQNVEEIIRVYENVNAHLNFRFEDIIRPKLFMNWYHLAVRFTEIGEQEKAHGYATKCLNNKPFTRHLLYKLKLLLRLNAPRVFNLVKR
jgi:glycosyltransferase involved in cell wall biosynthesis